MGKWYHAEDARPDYYVDVIATDGKSIFIAHVIGGLSLPIWCNKHSSGPTYVTHWMFLPELPEVK